MIRFGLKEPSGLFQRFAGRGNRIFQQGAWQKPFNAIYSLQFMLPTAFPDKQLHFRRNNKHVPHGVSGVTTNL